MEGFVQQQVSRRLQIVTSHMRKVYQPHQLYELERYRHARTQESGELDVQQMAGYQQYLLYQQYLNDIQHKSNKKFSDVQLLLLSHYESLCLHFFFPAEWQAHADKIRRVALPMSTDYANVWNLAASVPRQCGKSTVTAAFCAAMIAAVPDVHILVNSMGEPQTVAFVNMLKEAFYCLPDTVPSVTVDNKTKFVLATNSGVVCANGTEHSIRGLTGDLIINDEADFIPTKVITDTLLPIARREKVRMINISTYNVIPGSLFARYFALDSHFQKFTRAIRIVNMCAECVKSDQASCPHMQTQASHTNSKQRDKDIEVFYEGNRKRFRVEIMGTQELSVQPIFDADLVQRLFSPAGNFAPTFHRSKFDRVFMFADPAGGGNMSQTAAVCFNITPDGTVGVSI